MSFRVMSLAAEADDKGMREALRQFEFHIRTKNLSPKTITVYTERLGYFCRYLRAAGIQLEAVTKSIIQQYILSLKDRGLADISINGQIKVLKLFFKYLREEEMLPSDPAEKIGLMKTEKRFKTILTEGEIEKLLAVPDRRTFTGMRGFCMLLVFYDTLVRLNELINIKIADVNFESGTIRVFGKGRKERYVPFGPKTAKYVHKFLCGLRRDVPGDYLFCTSEGHPLDQRNVLRIIERMGQKVGVHVYPHLLRHSAASHRAISGMPAFLLQRLLGHTTLQMTQQYVHLADVEKLKAAFKQYSPLDTLRV